MKGMWFGGHQPVGQILPTEGPPRGPAVPPGPLALHVLQSSVFLRPGASHTDGLALLGDVAAAAWEPRNHTIRFLRPWVSPALAPPVWADLEFLFDSYLHNLAHLVDQLAQRKALTYPMVVQCSMGCHVAPDNSSFFEAAFEGRGFLGFSPRNGSWTRRRDDDVARDVQAMLNDDKGTSDTLTHLLNVTCPKSLLALGRLGKEDLERQVQPMAVVFAHETPDLSQLLLVCRVTGFYPSAVRVSWLRDGHEVAPQPGPGSSPLLPNADLTYQLRRAVAAVPGAAHGYACRVQHSSLGGRDLLLPWDPDGAQTGHVTWIVVVVVLLIAVPLAIIAFLYCRRHKSYEDVGAARRPGSLM
ncbi:antigen-presenting glycoprotein CD1d-like [Nothoprocta perdicaria]|uniref:antigen-presenting glycoprotein CD1d-like n=1 Tax=Nothoprocta perdicaria TaxID=30464 RepID=UPI000E1BC042|nr:antigen-presenting glycoprotein CD1d-like [Nothoprocta perdicaria]